jgi:hypothetical protein
VCCGFGVLVSSPAFLVVQPVRPNLPSQPHRVRGLLCDQQSTSPLWTSKILSFEMGDWGTANLLFLGHRLL